MSKRFMAAGFVVAAALFVTVTYGAVVSAEHAWESYHWARKDVNVEIPLTVVNSTTDNWDLIVGAAVGDWSGSTVLNMTQVDGSTARKDRRQCNATAGMLRICNLKYGQNGWLGIAGIAFNTDGHILYGYTKLNDSYLNSNYAGGYYNNDAWKQSVACQELGHNVGLGHVDEDFSTSTGSCMDYQDPPWPYTNQHDEGGGPHSSDQERALLRWSLLGLFSS